MPIQHSHITCSNFSRKFITFRNYSAFVWHTMPRSCVARVFVVAVVLVVVYPLAYIRDFRTCRHIQINIHIYIYIYLCKSISVSEYRRARRKRTVGAVFPWNHSHSGSLREFSNSKANALKLGTLLTLTIFATVSGERERPVRNSYVDLNVWLRLGNTKSNHNVFKTFPTD